MDLLRGTQHIVPNYWYFLFRTAGDIVPIVTLNGNGTAQGQYVKFECQSWYGMGCCLHYIGVANDLCG